MNQLAVKEWPQSVEKLQKSIIDNFLGFDDFFNINPLASLNSTFPPHNIINVGDGRYIIEMAVAGYSTDDIEIYEEDNSVVVEAKKVDTSDKNYIHKGMSYKAFKRVFPLSKNMSVDSATYKDGVLSIQFSKAVEDKKLIEIK